MDNIDVFLASSDGTKYLVFNDEAANSFKNYETVLVGFRYMLDFIPDTKHGSPYETWGEVTYQRDNFKNLIDSSDFIGRLQSMGFTPSEHDIFVSFNPSIYYEAD